MIQTLVAPQCLLKGDLDSFRPDMLDFRPGMLNERELGLMDNIQRRF